MKAATPMALDRPGWRFWSFFSHWGGSFQLLLWITWTSFEMFDEMKTTFAPKFPTVWRYTHNVRKMLFLKFAPKIPTPWSNLGKLKKLKIYCCSQNPYCLNIQEVTKIPKLVICSQIPHSIKVQQVRKIPKFKICSQKYHCLKVLQVSEISKLKICSQNPHYLNIQQFTKIRKLVICSQIPHSTYEGTAG